ILPAIGAITLTAGGVSAVIGSAAAAGMMYGMKEFSEIGKVVGASAAGFEKAEKRQRAFESGKFSELEHKVDELKALITGHSGAPEKAEAASAPATASASTKTKPTAPPEEE